MSHLLLRLADRAMMAAIGAAARTLITIANNSTVSLTTYCNSKNSAENPIQLAQNTRDRLAVNPVQLPLLADRLR